jgi:beta-lactamase class A
VPTAGAPPPQNQQVIAAAQDGLRSLPGTATGMFLDLGPGGEVVLRDADTVMPTGSVIKLIIAGEAYHQVAQGKLRLTDTFTVQQSDVVGGTGILQNQVGSTHTLDEMVEIMLVYSDNTAANMLIDRLGGFTPINNFAASLGLSSTRLNRRLMDTAAEARGVENVSTAREVTLFLLKLRLNQVVNPTYSQRITAILQERARDDRNWALLDLPADVDAEHISGTLTGLRVDAIVVNVGDTPYILVVFVQNQDEAAAEQAIRNASAEIYRAVTAR